ncbi:MAG: ferrous iron transport protein A [Oscillospiraceae bacterium]|jgi:ferrous iron transport protein A|nr:ferrous iron transport protein A [Oscillospiraceae bacterium]
MHHSQKNLTNLKTGDSARVKALLATGGIRRRLMDLGLVEGTTVKCVQESPSGDPVAYGIRGAIIALRREDAGTILVS